MTSMFWRRTVVLALLLALSGGHWAVLQTIAWSDMLIRYSAMDGWVRAAWKTFSGEAPCPMCKKIAASSQEDKLPAGMPQLKKLELFSAPVRADLPERAQRDVIFWDEGWVWTSRKDPPPVPPPLFA